MALLMKFQKQKKNSSTFNDHNDGDEEKKVVIALNYFNDYNLEDYHLT